MLSFIVNLQSQNLIAKTCRLIFFLCSGQFFSSSNFIFTCQLIFKIMHPLRFLMQSLLIALKTTSVYRHVKVNKSKIFNILRRKNIIFRGKTVINIEIFQNNISDYSFLRKVQQIVCIRNYLGSKIKTNFRCYLKKKSVYFYGFLLVIFIIAKR